MDDKQLAYELGYDKRTFIRCLDCEEKSFVAEHIRDLYCPWCRKHHPKQDETAAE
jgi:Zn finger protein HypA/HybF involved in hydrogenase expression